MKRSEVAKRLLPPVLVGAGVLVCLSVYAYTAFGSIPGALAYLRGARVHVVPAVYELGEVASGRTAEIEFSLMNLTDRRIQVLGTHVTCECAVLGELPRHLEARQSTVVRVAIGLSNEETSRFEGAVTVFTDLREQPEVVLGYRGTAIVSSVGDSRTSVSE